MSPLQFTRGVRSLNRLRHIAQVLSRHGFGHIVTRVNLGRFVPVWMLRKKGEAESTAGGETSVGRRLHGVNEIRELDRILNEEHGHIVADEIPVAALRI